MRGTKERAKNEGENRKNQDRAWKKEGGGRMQNGHDVRKKESEPRREKRAENAGGKTRRRPFLPSYFFHKKSNKEKKCKKQKKEEKRKLRKLPGTIKSRSKRKKLKGQR